MSYALHLQQQLAAMSNVVANVAAVLADVNVCQRQLQQSTTNLEFVPSRRMRLRQRRRRSVRDIYNELGAIYFQRAYRMTYQSFKRFAVLLRPYILAACGKTGTPMNYRNGPILPDVQLACAIQWFAGGSAYDIMTTFGISHTDTINSHLYVVDAINKHPAFAIAYPTDHDKQRSIAAGFSEVSNAGFDCCAGAIDGILLWIHKPSPRDCLNTGCSWGKFFCGRKKNSD